MNVLYLLEDDREKVLCDDHAEELDGDILEEIEECDFPCEECETYRKCHDEDEVGA